MLREFHEKARQLIQNTPSIPSVEVTDLRVKLIHEETEELRAAFDDGSIRDAADAIGDLLYVVLGTAVSCGIDIEPIFNEIHRSNMTKFIDGALRPDGKWMKGPSYSPVRLQPILDAQAAATAEQVINIAGSVSSLGLGG